jgi:DNA-binding NarL/FixJ family response regulator
MPIHSIEFDAARQPGADAARRRPVRACRRPMRILLVDGNQACLDALALLFSSDPGFEIVARVRSGWEALEKAAELRPEVVLMDLVIPGLNGLHVSRQLKARPQAPRVVFFSLCDAPEYRAEAQAAGADGFVSKLEKPDLLLALVRTFQSQRAGAGSPDAFV